MPTAFHNSYARLPDRFYVRQPPSRVKNPKLLFFNRDLAHDLCLDSEEWTGDDGIAFLAGNAVPPGAEPLAQAYAGHQFGGFVPQLGDGRALLLGEVIDRHGIRRDIQLKGSGPTPFSRMGDGRAWLGPVLREYIVSEAMHALGIPTTRALAAVATGETVYREAPLPGAVLTRVAQSHIRVGTFQYFAARQDTEALHALADHVIARHYPEAADAAALLDAVTGRQIALVAAWMGVGFIHGVMNTDNTQIAGETIDYGPCAFMDGFDPAQVFSSIDQFGRYAYNRQPEIIAWNLAQFASALLPLIDADRDAAIRRAQAIVDTVPERFQTAWRATFAAKLGLVDAPPGLIEDLLRLMADERADFTNTFRGLVDGSARDQVVDRDRFDAWAARWQAAGPDPDRLASANPAVIPRNHRIEQAIQAAVAGDLKPAERLIAALSRPYTLTDPDLTRPPAASEAVTATFCGT